LIGSLRLGCALLIAAALRTASVWGPPALPVSPYAPENELTSHDTLRRVKPEIASASAHLAGGAASVISGYLSARGLPPVPGTVSINDSGLVFQAGPGSLATFPLVGPLRYTGGRQWRASSVSLVYTDQDNGRAVYVFRIDAGVFETEDPGFLLDLSNHPSWLDSLAPTQWKTERPLVDPSDMLALQTKALATARTSYADTLYQLFGRPRAAIGLIGLRGQTAGRLGEYISAPDSLALDPGHMNGEAQLRHTLAHELGHRWQARAPSQMRTLWSGVPPIRDTKRYGYGDVTEHQAEAIAFAVNFLQTTAALVEVSSSSLDLLEHYELLVPGTGTMVHYLALQPLYRNHPLRTLLTTGRSS
jgi:hypothetical protein